MRAAAIFLAALILAAGCGQRGPLYLRDKPPPGVKPAKPAAYKPLPYPVEAEDDGEKKK